MGKQALSPQKTQAAIDKIADPGRHRRREVDPSTPSSASDSKTPFRSRKIRKLSPEQDIAAAAAGSGEVGPPKTPPPMSVLPRPLTSPGELAAALSHLRSADPLLSPLIDSLDPPAFKPQPCEPFPSLARSILYQQLATGAASSIYSRFLALCGGEGGGGGGPDPSSVLLLSPSQLRSIGVSARKASYLHDLALKFHSGVLSDSSLLSIDDASLLSALTVVRGIGQWSVHMFLIFSLHRPDVLPAGDLGVRKGVRMLYGLSQVPKPSQVEELCQRWSPYRTVGAWYMWRLLESKGLPTVASASAAPPPGPRQESVGPKAKGAGGAGKETLRRGPG